MNACTRCGGKFPTRTSGIEPDATLCTNADQCDRNYYARRDAVVLLRSLVDYTREDGPRDGECWLLNAALHLEGRMPAHRISAEPFDIPDFSTGGGR